MATVFLTAGEYRTPQGRLRPASAAEKAQLAQFPERGQGTAFVSARSKKAVAPANPEDTRAVARSGPSYATRLRYEDGPGDGPGDGLGAAGTAAVGRTATLGFDDLLDLVNPLQHIPVISTLYRAVTGDKIQAPVQVAGGALFGGPVGFVAALANAFIDDAAGQDLGEMALAALTDDVASDKVQVAAQIPAPQTAALAAPPSTATELDKTSDAGTAAPADAAAAPEAATREAATLTGAAALQAVTEDLRSLAVGTAPLAAPQSAELPPSGTATAAVAEKPAGPVPAAFDPAVATVSANGFAERMLQALDRYEEMAKTPGPGRAGAVRVDTEL